ncbi:MAG: hypothetical protein V1779_09540 [bacterium]
MKRYIFILSFFLFFNKCSAENPDYSKFLRFSIGENKSEILEQIKKNKNFKLIEETKREHENGLEQIYYIPKYENQETNCAFFIFIKNKLIAGSISYIFHDENDVITYSDELISKNNRDFDSTLYKQENKFRKYYVWIKFIDTNIYLLSLRITKRLDEYILHTLIVKIEKEDYYKRNTEISDKDSLFKEYLEKLVTNDNEKSGIPTESIYIYKDLDAGYLGFWDLPKNASKMTIKKLMKERSEALPYPSGSEQLLYYKVLSIAGVSVDNLHHSFDDDGKYDMTSINFKTKGTLESTFNIIHKKISEKFGSPKYEYEDSSDGFNRTSEWLFYTFNGQTKITLQTEFDGYDSYINLIYFK